LMLGDKNMADPVFSLHREKHRNHRYVLAEALK
jgi:hypothetical protein